MSTFEQHVAMLDEEHRANVDLEAVLDLSIDEVAEKLHIEKVPEKEILKVLPELRKESTVSVPGSIFTIIRKGDHTFDVLMHNRIDHAA